MAVFSRTVNTSFNEINIKKIVFKDAGMKTNEQIKILQEINNNILNSQSKIAELQAKHAEFQQIQTELMLMKAYEENCQKELKQIVYTLKCDQEETSNIPDKLSKYFFLRLLRDKINDSEFSPAKLNELFDKEYAKKTINDLYESVDNAELQLTNNDLLDLQGIYVLTKKVHSLTIKKKLIESEIETLKKTKLSSKIRTVFWSLAFLAFGLPFTVSSSAFLFFVGIFICIIAIYRIYKGFAENTKKKVEERRIERDNKVALRELNIREIDAYINSCMLAYENIFTRHPLLHPLKDWLPENYNIDENDDNVVSEHLKLIGTTLSNFEQLPN